MNNALSFGMQIYEKSRNFQRNCRKMYKMMTIGQKVKTTIRFFEYFFVTSQRETTRLSSPDTTHSATRHRYEHHRSAARTGGYGDCRTHGRCYLSGGSRCWNDDFQPHLLGFRIPAHGHQRHDGASLGRPRLIECKSPAKAFYDRFFGYCRTDTATAMAAARTDVMAHRSYCRCETAGCHLF